jgi:hypothetical protein
LTKESSKLLDQRKQAKLQWLQNLSQMNGDNSKTFRKREKEHLKNKINKLETNIKKKNIGDLYRGIN